jgi:methionyl-tRNA formyltransferase
MSSSAPERARVIVACANGPYQRYLCARVAAEHDLAGVILHNPTRPKGSVASRLKRLASPLEVLRYFRTRRLVARYDAAARELVEQLLFVDGREPQLDPSTEIVPVDNVNAPEALALIARLRPDLVCVNGTNLLRDPILALGEQLRFGIINLHTGLSPYSRGGNCNLFMLDEGRPELVGVTVHHIDRGIDSGDLIITARPTLEPGDTHETIDAKAFRLGIDLMLVAIRQLLEGRAERVTQWQEGKLFLRRTGYVYDRTVRVRVNRAIEKGLIREYLAHREERDRGVRLVGKTE